MGTIVVLLSIIGFLVFFAYLKFPPSYAKKNLVSIFNMTALSTCAFICAMWVWKTHGELADGPDAMWWEGLACMGALAIEIVFLGLCFLLRNFYIFRPPRQGRSGFFRF